MKSARFLKGKTIERIEPRSFDPSEDGSPRSGIAYDPVVHFTDGSSMFCAVQECEGGQYGVELVYVPATRKRKAVNR